MRIKTSIETTRAACGFWPANAIADVQSVRNYFHKQGFFGTPIYMATSPYVFDILRWPMANSDKSYLQYLEQNQLLHGTRIIEHEPTKAIFATYETKLSNYPDIEVGFCFIEITDIDTNLRRQQPPKNT